MGWQGCRFALFTARPALYMEAKWEKRMWFWIIITLLAVLVVSRLALTLLRGRPGTEPAAAYDLRVYRDQLKEVERDLARGVIAEADADRVRAEVSRRILAADAQLHGETTGEGSVNRAGMVIAALLGIGVIGGSLLLYLDLGSPGYDDLGRERRIELAAQARADRPSQAKAEADTPQAAPPANISEDYRTLMTRLRKTVKARPDDLQGQTLLARNEAMMGNFVAAHRAQAEVLRIKGDSATASEYSEYADMLVLAAGGYVSPEAEKALKAALKLDPRDGPARFYWGLMMAQTGRPDLAFRTWDALLRESLPTAPWVAPIRSMIEQVAAQAGVEFTLPPLPDLPGPTAGDVAAAGNLSASERQAKIQGMVDKLSNRLATQGGSPQEWARLINALGVLGETDRARAIRDEARKTFASDKAALALIDDASVRAGLIRPPLPGPDQADVNAASQMSDADRQAMIQSMISRLSDRLDSQGGSPQEWARLIGALGVLGQTDKARAAYDKAMQAHGNDTAALAPIQGAARKAGVIE